MVARRLILSICAVAFGGLVFASGPALAARGDYVLSGSFGGPGTGPGEFEKPAGVAVNEANGDVYVVDRGNDRVEYFALNAATKAYEYAGEFNGSGLLLNEVTGAPSGRFSSPQYIAVDNDPGSESYGDVYVTDQGHGVIDKFSATGEYLFQLKEGAAGDLFGGEGASELGGVAVAPDGVLWVAREGGYPTGTPPSELVSFSGARENVYLSTTPGLGEDISIGGGTAPLAVNASEDAYVDTYTPGGIREISGSGEFLSFAGGAATGVAVELPAGDVYLDSGHSIAIRSGSGGALIEEFASGQFSGGRGVAVSNSAPYGVYVADVTTNTVMIFKGVPLPGVSTGEATGLLSEGSAVLNGTVDPEGEPLSSCELQYVAASEYEAGVGEPYKGHSSACTPSAIELGEGTKNEPVHADLTGLTPSTTYHYRLTASNSHGTVNGEDHVFTTSGPPSVTEDRLSNVTARDMTLGAKIDTHGLDTTYTVEYGTSEAYGSTAEGGTLTTSFAGPQAVSTTLQEGALQPEATYHARIVATNADGTQPGADITFTTLSDLAGLPDGRGYEMVSPVANAEGNVYQPGHGFGGNSESSESPMQASADGNAVEYVADPLATGGNGQLGAFGGNEYVAERAAGGGWGTVDLETPGVNKPAYQGMFSSELSSSGTSTVPAGSHILSQDVEGLTDSVGGSSLLVSVLPSTRPGEPGVPAADATFGSPGSAIGPGPDLSHVISADGSHIFWSTMESYGTLTRPTALYVRENGTRTVQVDATQGPGPSGDGRFWAASSDGSKVFFADCNKLTEDSTAVSTDGCAHEESLNTEVSTGNDLYEYNVNTGALSDLTVDQNPADALGANVQGVVGASEDGSYVYFVAGGVLAENENSEKEKALPQTCERGNELGEDGTPCNLYVRHQGITTFIAALTSYDMATVGSGGPHDLATSLANRTAEVAPDGHSVVFMSVASLTGYDNNLSKKCEPNPSSACSELFVYDAETGRLACASCNPTGLTPVDDLLVSLPGSFSAAFTHRWISEDGSRVFFDSTEALVAQDTNGKQDVYEWEREGTGSCARVVPARSDGGCIYLLSGGTSNDRSYFLDASASGDDVFIITRARLTPQDRGEVYELYDARVGAAQQAPGETTCTGTGCQGLPSPPPVFATPSSVTFNGVGNFAPPPPASTTKKTVKCAKDKKLAHGKCVGKKAKRNRKKAKKAKKPSRDRRAS